MPDNGPEEWIVTTEDAKTLPVQELLTGRGFVSGKSGSGKSNTVSVICEELLEANFTLLIIDTEGEYFGLKEEYELLHVGGDDFAEVQVGPEHADKIAEIALEKNVPVILDVSGYDDTETSEELITRVVDELYTREKRVRKPFLLVVEEMQEYLPQQGGSGELGELLERVAKRGRKRGLGMCGVSQRPSSVDKDYITQCDWMVWHKFTWESDLKVVSNVIGKDRADECENFDPGEAYMMTDWDDTIERVKFRRKSTFDAGATPGLESFERPNLKQVGEQLISEIQGEATSMESSAPDPVATDGSTSTSGDPDPFENIEAGSTRSDAISGAAAPAADTEGRSDAPAGNAGSADLAHSTGVESLSEADLDELDEGEIVEKVNRVKQENLILKDEIEELRDISDTDPAADSSPFTDSPPFSGAASRSRPRPYGPSQDAASDATSITPPTRPEPPVRQDVDNPAARILFEFGDLMMYLWQVLIYYVLYSLYKVRVWLWEDSEQDRAKQRQRGRPD
ncbi:ATP-binding protein [Halorubrum trueperi]|uniref:ATP-binding protein n=1 Tax=Halorubrum trueperi TaxID=2004704 RepID=A0ABD5UPW2_9EURY